MSDTFRKYADSYHVAEQIRQFPKDEVVCCNTSLKSRDGELLSDTLLLTGIVRLSESGKRKIKGVFADETDDIRFFPADVEYNVIYRNQNYFWTQNERDWWITGEHLYLAKGAEAEQFRKKARTERKLDKLFFVMFCIAVSILVASSLYLMVYWVFNTIFPALNLH